MSIAVRNLIELKSLPRAIGDIIGAIKNIETTREMYIARGDDRGTASVRTLDGLLYGLDVPDKQVRLIINKLGVDIFQNLTAGDTLTRAAERTLDNMLEDMRNLTVRDE